MEIFHKNRFFENCPPGLRQEKGCVRQEGCDFMISATELLWINLGSLVRKDNETNLLYYPHLQNMSPKHLGYTTTARITDAYLTVLLD